MTYRNRKPVAIGLIALVTILFGLFLAGPKLIGPPFVDADHPFNTSATLERLSRILGDESPHPVDSPASDAVIERLLGEIRRLGFTPQVDDAFHCSTHWRTSCARVRNVGFWVGEPGPDAVMIASHHDSVPTGPGAADDGMGVASSLEIARVMAERARTEPLRRPLYVLITDGEEVGLIGASHFVANSPVAPMIGAVVSLEARGNAGIATMFETSDPNGRDLAALRRYAPAAIKRPLTNSLAVDIYRAMPNGTDVTEYLTLGIDAANYAMVGRPSHYHTGRDDLAHLNPRSVFHVGASALAAADGFMTTSADAPDTNHIYSDILGFGVIALPDIFALPLIGLALLMCGIALWRRQSHQMQSHQISGTPLLRVLLLPVLALSLGTVLAVLAGLAVDALRPERAFGSAYPVAFRGLILAVSLLGATLVARWLYRPNGADRYLAGAWGVIMAIGLAASLLFPGAAVMFALPALFVIPGAILLALRIGLAARLLFALAALLSLALLLPTHAQAETALFVETSAPLMALAMWIFVTALPLMWRRAGLVRAVLAGLGVATVGFAAASLLVPAHTFEAPQRLNLLHVDGDGYDGAVYAISAADPLPDALSTAAPFTLTTPPGFSAPVWTTDAVAARDTRPTVTLDDTRVADGRRSLSLRIDAPDADMLSVLSYDDAPAVERLSVNGVAVARETDAFPSIECTGRACRSLRVEIDLVDESIDDPAEPFELTLWSTRYGLGPDGALLRGARPDWAVPQHDGDRRMVRTQIIVTGPE